MRCLTLSQPWATLITIGAKRVETRRWHPHENPGVIVIASSKKPMSAAHRRLLDFEPFSSALNGTETPVGCLLAVARLRICRRTEEIVEELSEHERAFGDYSPRRWAWEFDVVEQLDEPVPIPSAKPGEKKTFRLGLWDVPKTLITPELTEAVLAVERA